MKNQVLNSIRESRAYALYESFSPASQAAILFAIPFTVVDALHYYTAGTALIISLPVLAVIYVLCGASAARIALARGRQDLSLPRTGGLAALRLWLISTAVNSLIAILLGFTTVGLTLLSGAFYLCLSAPLQIVGSVALGILGGWIQKEIARRTQPIGPAE